MTLTIPDTSVEMLVPSDPLGFDRSRAEAAVEELLRALGRDTDDPHVADTPGTEAAFRAHFRSGAVSIEEEPWRTS